MYKSSISSKSIKAAVGYALLIAAAAISALITGA
jgi:hypothetical protein